MIKFFRKIRQNLLNQGKTTKYFKYAIGEIVLVVIGILIALWINNLNTENNQNKERLTLITNLKQELNENKKQIDFRHKRLTNINKKLIKVLNFSSNSKITLPIDSLKLYVTNALTFGTVNLSNSRLSSAKSSGRFNLLSENITASFADYETSIDNYRHFLKATTYTFKEEWFKLIVRFKSMKEFHNMIYPNTIIDTHPNLVLTDMALEKYLKQPQTYEMLHKYYTKYMIEKAWLREVIYRIDSTLKTIEEES